MLNPLRAHRRLLLAWILAGATAAHASESTGEIVTAAAVRALEPAAAAQRKPVRLRGNLIFVTPFRDALVLRDHTDGIYVAVENELRTPLQLGDVLEVRGESEAGDFAPIVRARHLERIAPGTLPQPRPTTIAELNAGGFDAAWVELRGIVRACRPAPTDRQAVPRVSWLVTFAQGSDQMDLRIEGALDPQELVDAEVRLRGVVFNVHNANRQFVRASLQVADRSMVEVIDPPPADPFARPRQKISEVLRFSQTGFTGRRVHVQGVVVGHFDGHTLWLREGDRGMRIASAQSGSLHPGDLVDVAGFPDHGAYTPSLSDAIFRKVVSGPVPAPLPLTRPEDISRYDANLVQLEAELREIRRTAEGLQLVMLWHGLEVHGRLAATEAPSAAWQPGSQLRVTGICIAGQTEFPRLTGLWVADDLHLWIRSPQDIAVVRRAPWLTTRRALVAGLAIAAVALVALAAMATGTRRQLARREAARRLAEAEFAAMLAERNRLAREIHDTVAQDLNAVSMQLELAKNATKAGKADAVGPFLNAAHQIVRHCLASARESIWDMRSHVLERHELVSAVRLVAEQLRGGMTCEIRTRVQGRPRRLPPNVENSLLRIGQEAVSNALKHAHPRLIELDFSYQDSVVSMAVADDGPGITAMKSDETDSRFGLRGMRERVARMNGQLTIGPRAEGGTRVEVIVTAPSLG